ncbi:MAG: glycosyltransferase [Promethearchaeota archaeon]
MYHILSYFFRDNKYRRATKIFKDPIKVNLEDLKELPLINIIIPAWKEGKIFEECLLSITKLSYPNLKVIVNAGGNDETIEIANSFRKEEKFLILNQKPGGKMKALNECLKFVKEGIIYSIDADVFLTDEVLLRMIYPIINLNEDVVVSGVKPLKFQENKHLVKYILISRYPHFKVKFSRYGRTQISGPNTCFRSVIYSKIGKFEEDNYFPESDRFRGLQIISKGYKIFQLIDYRSFIYTFYPDSIKSYISQELRWRKNKIEKLFYKKSIILTLKMTFLFFLSFFIVISPVLIFFNMWVLLIALLLFFNKYLKKIRQVLFFNLVVEKKYFPKFGFFFFIKTLFFIYLEELMTVYLLFSLIFSRKEVPTSII